MTEPTDKHRDEARERTIDKLHRETGTPTWALETAFELSACGMLDEETMAGLRVIPDAAGVIAEHTASRDAEIREVLEGLSLGTKCWCPVGQILEHTPACLATRALWEKVQPKSTK